MKTFKGNRDNCILLATGISTPGMFATAIFSMSFPLWVAFVVSSVASVLALNIIIAKSVQE